MVVLGIMLVITGATLASQSSFNKTLILSNTAYDIGLTLRSAATYGLGSRAAGTATNAGYGIHVDRAVPGSFYFFADTYPGASTSSVCHPVEDASSPAAKPGNCVFDEEEGELVTAYALGNGIEIRDFCAETLGEWSCATSGDEALSTLDIVFARPNAEAYMSANGAYSASSPIIRSCITVASPSGAERYLSVSTAGQVVGNAPSCP